MANDINALSNKSSFSEIEFLSLLDRTIGINSKSSCKKLFQQNVSKERRKWDGSDPHCLPPNDFV